MSAEKVKLENENILKNQFDNNGMEISEICYYEDGKEYFISKSYPSGKISATCFFEYWQNGNLKSSFDAFYDENGEQLLSYVNDYQENGCIELSVLTKYKNGIENVQINKYYDKAGKELRMQYVYLNEKFQAIKIENNYMTNSIDISVYRD